MIKSIVVPSLTATAFLAPLLVGTSATADSQIDSGLCAVIRESGTDIGWSYRSTGRILDGSVKGTWGRKSIATENKTSCYSQSEGTISGLANKSLQISGRYRLGERVATPALMMKWWATPNMNGQEYIVQIRKRGSWTFKKPKTKANNNALQLDRTPAPTLGTRTVPDSHRLSESGAWIATTTDSDKVTFYVTHKGKNKVKITMNAAGDVWIYGGPDSAPGGA